MITLHRLGHKLEIFRLNPDLIVTVEANPDTVITLATGAKIVVAETPERVVAEVRAYRVDILAGALGRRHELRADGRSAPAAPHVRLALSDEPSSAGLDRSHGSPPSTASAASASACQPAVAAAARAPVPPCPARARPLD